MSVVRVGDKWVNPDKVIWIGYTKVNYSGEAAYWRASIRCDEGQGWDWKFPSEEDADRKCDELAAQVNRTWQPGDAARLPKDIPYEETLR